MLERMKAPFTLRGLVAELAGRGLKADRRTVCAFVHRSGYSFNKTALASKQERPDMARRRARWKRHQGRIDPRRLVFIPLVLCLRWLLCDTGAAARHVIYDGQWRGSDRSPLGRCGPLPSMVAPVFSFGLNGYMGFGPV